MGESRRRGKAERIHPPRGRIEGVGLEGEVRPRCTDDAEEEEENLNFRQVQISAWKLPILFYLV